jgi:ribonuclease HI
VGWGAVAYTKGGHCAWETNGASPGLTIYDAEMRAVAEALHVCPALGPGRVLLFCDNHAVVTALKGRAPLSSGALARQLQTSLEKRG